MVEKVNWRRVTNLMRMWLFHVSSSQAAKRSAGDSGGFCEVHLKNDREPLTGEPLMVPPFQADPSVLIRPFQSIWMQKW